MNSVNPFIENTYGSIQNFIAGQFERPSGQTSIDVFEPATGIKYNSIPRSSSATAEIAIEAAQKAFPDWSKLSSRERAKYLFALADKIEERVEEFALAESIDSGKPLSVAREVDIPRSILNLRFFAEAISQIHSESFAENISGQSYLNYVLQQPLGVVVGISPWNLPLYLLTWKLAPALAAGNCVVGKPSEVTPLTAFLLAKAAKDVNFPPGVLNIVHGLGSEIGKALCEHPKVKAITFTGSTATGRAISLAAASQFKKLALEMGGKNPSIVFADCDFNLSVSEVARAAFSNQGQICLCGSRILVQEEIYEKFKRALVATVAEIRTGDPLLPETRFGAIVSKEHYDKIQLHLQLAKKDGGIVLHGGQYFKPNSRCEKGWFIQPTLIEGLPNSARTNQEEIFGPVATLIPFKNESDALELANATNYGLAVNLWTQDLSRAHRLAQQLEFGIVWINSWMKRDLRTPFGGVKNSGLGREGGFEALRFFSEAKTVSIQFQSGVL